MAVSGSSKREELGIIELDLGRWDRDDSLIN